MRSVIIALLAGLFVAPSAIAQQYPVRPIRIVVAFAPGGASDVLARLLAERLTEAFGQTVVVDNRPSAGGIIGTDLVAKAVPDGYTLLIGSAAAFAITPHLQTKLPYDTTKDFMPIAPFTSLAFVLNVHPDVKATSVKELIALAKSRPGTLNIGSAGNGTTTHIVGEMFKYAAGIDMVHVPYKGAAPAMVDLIGGRIHVLFDAAVTTLPQWKARRVRALAVGGTERSPLFPELPTIGEAGLPGFTAGNWFGVFAPARTAAAVVTRLNAEITKAVISTAARQAMAAIGAQPLSASPEQFRRLVQSEYERYGKLIKAAGIKFD